MAEFPHTDCSFKQINRYQTVQTKGLKVDAPKE
jgi:hypothetical protein